MHTLREAAAAHEGAEDDRGQFHFETVEKALQAASALGSLTALEGAGIPPLSPVLHRRAILRAGNKDQLILEIPVEDGDVLPRWCRKGKKWFRGLGVKADQRSDADRIAPYDDIVRLLDVQTEMGRSTDRWAVKDSEGKWLTTSDRGIVKCVLKARRIDEDPDVVMGLCAHMSWHLVNEPFQPEYPGGRKWNRNAPQYAYKPAPGPHPHWDRILNHIGKDLDSHLDYPGAQYLLYWIACLLRDPFEPLPYLFIFGPQNSGKSIIHEAIALLITKGVVSADRALTNTNDFNGELANAVLCYIEEKNIAAAGQSAYNKIKDWVTSRQISIRKMRTDSYQQPNTTHWIQVANEQSACPIFPGDTRITVIYVPDLEEEIPKRLLLARLREEAPAFLHTVLNLELPPPVGRLRLPVIETQHKQRIAQNNTSEIATGIIELMSDRFEWTGTTAQLCEAIGISKRDGRVVNREIQDHHSLLSRHGITVTKSPRRTTVGRPLTITKCSTS